MLSSIDLSLESTLSLEHFWNLESIGINESPVTLNDNRAIDNFNKTINLSTVDIWSLGHGKNPTLTSQAITN